VAAASLVEGGSREVAGGHTRTVPAPSGQRPRPAARWFWLTAGGLAALLGLAAVVFWQQRAVAAGGDSYCAQVWASFDRTSKWARELGGALEAAASESAEIVGPRLQSVRHGLDEEAELLRRLSPPDGVEVVQAHALATLNALLAAADPVLLDTDPDTRQQMGPYLREQLLLARGEARAAATALRAADEDCAGRHAPGGLRALSRQRESGAAD
jgi:hypothetical protein